jgi:hypothetical protein
MKGGIDYQRSKRLSQTPNIMQAGGYNFDSRNCNKALKDDEVGHKKHIYRCFA